MEEAENPADVQARIVAGRLLTLGAGRASANADRFSTWFLSGFGAAFALLFANVDEVSRHLAIESLRSGLFVFLVALLLGILSRWLAGVVAGGVEAAKEAEIIGRDLANSDIEVNNALVLRETERATLWPTRLLVAASFKKVEAGDLAAGGRMLARLAQVQGILVALEVLIAGIAVVILACGLSV